MTPRLDIYGAIAYLKLHGLEVGERYQAGDPLATKVVEYYRLAYACSSDLAAQTFLCCALEDYIKAYPAPEGGSTPCPAPNPPPRP